jgi:hypothetical protein
MTLSVHRHTTILDAVAGNAAEASRTLEMNCEKDFRLGIYYGLAQDSATTMTIQAYLSNDGGSTWGLVQSVAISAGTGTLSDYTISNAVSGDEQIWLGIDCEAADRCKVIFGGAGLAAADKITGKLSGARNIR